MFRLRLFVLIVCALAIAGFVSIPRTASAETAEETTERVKRLTTADPDATGLFKGVTIACWKDGSCTLCDSLVVFINVANGILRLLAIVATIFFVYGAGLMMLSQGNEDWVSKGKSAMKATIVGTIITICAWQIMSIVVFVVANAQNNQKQAVFEGARGEQNPTPQKYNPLTSWYTIAEVCVKAQK